MTARQSEGKFGEGVSKLTDKHSYIEYEGRIYDTGIVHRQAYQMKSLQWEQ